MKQPHAVDRVRERAIPLSELPPEMRARITELVARPEPPPRYIRLCDGLLEMESRAWYEWYWQRGLRPVREKLCESVRLAVIERDGLVCGICGGDVAPDDVHIDHVKPVVLGGPTVLSNLRVTHSKCNLRKGAR